MPAEATLDPATFQMPEGEPTERARRAGVLDTVRQLLACLNVGNFLAFSALYTDELVVAQGPRTADDLAFLAAEPVPQPAGNQAALLAIVDVRALPDGRVAGLFDV
jgi:hypothetical protein